MNANPLKIMICSNCVSYLEHGYTTANHDTSILESIRRKQSLKELSDNKITPLGLSKEEGFYSPYDCELCGQLPGIRHNYIFRENK